MTEIDQKTYDLLTEFRNEVRFAVAKRLARQGASALSHSDLTAGAQECLCILGGLLPGTPSVYNKITEWREVTTSENQLHRYVQHALDWALAKWCRAQIIREQHRPADLSLDMIPSTQGDYADYGHDPVRDEPEESAHARFPSPVSPDDPAAEAIMADFWRRYPLLAFRYRDGETADEIGARLGVSRSVASKRTRNELARAKRELAPLA